MTGERAELTVAMGFFIVLAIAGASLVVATVRDFGSARASAAWPAVEGVALSDAAGGFRYAYAVEGRNFQSRRVQFATAGFKTPRPETAPGETLLVQVDPQDARVAVIEPGGSALVFAVYAGLAGLLAFIGVGGVIRTLIVSQESEPQLAEA